MTEEQPNIFARMHALALKLVNLAGVGQYGGAPQAARSKLAERIRALDRVSIKAVPLFHGAEVDPQHAMTAERIRNSMRKEYEALGYVERHDALIKVADDLEAASADLPAIAAEVFMEAKRVADDLRAEATKGLAEWQTAQEKSDGSE